MLPKNYFAEKYILGAVFCKCLFTFCRLPEVQSHIASSQLRRACVAWRFRHFDLWYTKRRNQFLNHQATQAIGMAENSPKS